MADAIYVSAANTGAGEMAQEEWASFIRDVFRIIAQYRMEVVFWHSTPDAMFQSACWCFEPLQDDEGDRHRNMLVNRLALITKGHPGQTISWDEATHSLIAIPDGV
jgi:hypothetical protein